MIKMKNEPDHFDGIIIETDTLLMRIRMRFAEYIICAIDVLGNDISKLEVAIPYETGSGWVSISVKGIFIDSEDELIYILTEEDARIQWDELSIYAQQLIIDSLHIVIRVSQNLNKPPTGTRIN